MHSPSFERALEALALALGLPAAVLSLATFNPLLGVWVAGVALLHTVFLAFPVFLVLRRFGWVNVATSTVTGLVIGTVSVAIVFWGIPGQLTPFAWFGAASGLLFGAWLWLRERLSAKPASNQAPDCAASISH